MNAFERYAPELSGRVPRPSMDAPAFSGVDPTGAEALLRWAPRIKPADWSPFGRIGLRFSLAQLVEFATDESRLANIPETVNRVLELAGKIPVTMALGDFEVVTPWIGGPNTGFLDSAAVAVPLLDEAVYVGSLNVTPQANIESVTLFIEGVTAVRQPDHNVGAQLAIYTIATAFHDSTAVPPVNNMAIVEKAPWMPMGLIRLRAVGKAINAGVDGEIQIGAYALVQARAPIPIEYRLSKTSPGDVLVPTRTS